MQEEPRTDTVLITGASGFIGSFLAEEGLKRHFTVTAGIRKTSSRKYLQDPGIRFLEFDLSSPSAIRATLAQCREEGIRFRYIIHNAGVTKARKKEEYHNVNFLSTKYFMEALAETGMIPEKFIYISSLAACGPGDPVSGKPVMLGDTPRPIDRYGRSKLEAEQYIRASTGIPWVIIRPTGVYGPREQDYYVFFKTISRGLETYIGAEKQILTFIYVRDLVRAIFDALVSEFSGRTYFVSDGQEYDTETFAAIAKRHLRKKTVRIVVPAPIVRGIAFILEKLYGLWGAIPTLNTDKYRILVSRNWRCENEPLQKDLGFRAAYDLDKGVKETVDWYKQNGWL
jgi:nucleoside-diphosphate-sugar epimerase